MKLTAEQLQRLVGELRSVADGVEQIETALAADAHADALHYPNWSTTARLAAVLLDDVEIET